MSSNAKMEELGVCIYPPNKPMDPVIDFSTTPKIYDNMMFVDFNSNGACILGSSSIANTFWEGTLLYFESANHMDRFDHRSHYIYSTSSDGIFINDEMIALAEDTGLINILKLDQDNIIRSVNFCKMVERIPQIAVWENSSRVLSCSGRTVAVWDVESNDHSKKSFAIHENYHMDKINSVDVKKDDLNLFISAAADRKAVLWDLRSDFLCSVLYSNEFCSLSSIAWNQTDSNYISIGTQAGDIYLIDKREPKEFVSVLHSFKDRIHRMAYNKNQLAVCADSNEILIIDSENGRFEEKQKINRHEKYVRGLKWFGDKLYSCGFDKQVVAHEV